MRQLPRPHAHAHASAIAIALALAASAASARAQQPDAHAMHDHAHAHGQDSAFAAMQARGQHVMGVDQYASTHRFDSLPDGGRITYRANRDDGQAVRTIREHLRGVARAFAAGDFSSPATVHDREVPGARVMAERRARIRYDYRDVTRGGAVRIRTRDARALAAVHEFLAFQRAEHHAGGMH